MIAFASMSVVDSHLNDCMCTSSFDLLLYLSNLWQQMLVIQELKNKCTLKQLPKCIRDD